MQLLASRQGACCAGGGDSQDEVAGKARALAEVTLGECADVALGRAAAELFACAACIGGDSFAVQLLRALNTAAAEATSIPRWVYSHVRSHTGTAQGILRSVAWGACTDAAALT